MAVGRRNAAKPLVADMIVENHEGLPILLVEVKARKADSRTINQVTNYMRILSDLASEGSGSAGDLCDDR